MIFNWILINELAIGTPPISIEDQIFLKDKKISAILDLRNEFDFKITKSEKHCKNFPNFNYVNIGLPDHNSKRLATKDEIEYVLSTLEEILKNGSVFMHCHAAVERSPLISIAFLKKNKGLSLIQAYEYVKQQNKTTSVLMEQLLKI